MAGTETIKQHQKERPVPVDDGACNHLTGTKIPDIRLKSTSGRDVLLSNLSGRVVLYIYPRTGRPDQELPAGWNEIPGALGCTPEACAFRDHHNEINQLGARVFGLSTQDSEYQLEAVTRLHLPYELLSDHELLFATSLNLPVFTVENMTLYKRITLIIHDGVIEKVFYPVFPPEDNAEEVLDWLAENH